MEVKSVKLIIPKRFVKVFQAGYEAGINGWGAELCGYERKEFVDWWKEGNSYGREKTSVIVNPPSTARS